MKKLSRKEDAVGAWEDEGGALAPADCPLKSPAAPDPGLKCVPSESIAMVYWFLANLGRIRPAAKDAPDRARHAAPLHHIAVPLTALEMDSVLCIS